jgi:hypothetical protein
MRRPPPLPSRLHVDLHHLYPACVLPWTPAVGRHCDIASAPQLVLGASAYFGALAVVVPILREQSGARVQKALVIRTTANAGSSRCGCAEATLQENARYMRVNRGPVGNC